MNIFYITFCWERRYKYDGYIIRYSNHKIIGYTDDSIIAGDASKIREFKEYGILDYNIQEDAFLNTNAYYGILHINGHPISIKIKRTYKKTEEQIKSRIENNLEYFSPTIRKAFIENYLTEE